jgi:PAS domain-containing protein
VDEHLGHVHHGSFSDRGYTWSRKFLDAFGGLFHAFADNWCPIVVGAVEERILVTQADGKLRYLNPQAESLFGQSSAAAWDMHLLDLLLRRTQPSGPTDTPEVHDVLAQMRQAPAPSTPARPS